MNPCDVLASVVIPILRDQAALEHLLSRLIPDPACEVIVAGTEEERSGLETLARGRAEVRTVYAPIGRARQMNAGAAVSTSRWLLFLHADTHLPAGWLDEVRAADRAPGVVAGCFAFALDSPARAARVIEWGVRQRVRFLALPYGDQTLFVRRDAFQALGGYRPLPILEDLDLVRRLRAVGRLWVAPAPAVTSARRWERDGWVRRSLSNVLIATGFVAGVSPRWLARRHMSRSRQAIGVLARAPGAGGKTRLWQDLGASPEPGLAESLLRDTLTNLQEVDADVVVFTTPAAHLTEVQALAHPREVVLQRGDDLGARMRAAFADLFSWGYHSAVLVGGDLPTLPPTYVRRALRLLGRPGEQVVLGPADDGGYYLIGLRRERPELFAGVSWGESVVLDQTLARATAAGLGCRLLPSWFDVDRLQDLRKVVEPTHPHSAPAHLTRAWVARTSAVRMKTAE